MNIELLKGCINCDIKRKVKTQNRCKLCYFKIGADGAETNYIMKKYFQYPIGIPKSRFFFFLHHPELNFKFPDLPEEDIFGSKRSNHSMWIWVIHHEDDNHSNDSIWNLILLLNTEHHKIHIYNENPMDNWDKKDFSNHIRNKYRERYKNSKSLDKNKEKYYKMIDFLNQLKSGEYVITKTFSKKLGYSEPFSLRYGIQSVIKNRETKNISLTTNGKEHRNKRWIIKKA